MGCGASKPEDGAGSNAENDQHSTKHHDHAHLLGTGKSDDAKERAYLEGVASITSAEFVLFHELDTRTQSAFEDATEPSQATLAVRQKAISMRGKLKFGVTDDVNQYDATTETPEFKQRDRKRVLDWLAAVPEKPDDIPLDSFYLPLGESSHSSGAVRPVERIASAGGLLGPGITLEVHGPLDKSSTSANTLEDHWSTRGRNKSVFTTTDPMARTTDECGVSLIIEEAH